MAKKKRKSQLSRSRTRAGARATTNNDEDEEEDENEGSDIVPLVALPGPVRHLVLTLLWSLDTTNDDQVLDAGHVLCSSAAAETPRSAQDILSEHLREDAIDSILVFSVHPQY